MMLPRVQGARELSFNELCQAPRDQGKIVGRSRQPHACQCSAVSSVHWICLPIRPHYEDYLFEKGHLRANPIVTPTAATVCFTSNLPYLLCRHLLHLPLCNAIFTLRSPRLPQNLVHCGILAILFSIVKSWSVFSQ